MPSEQRLHPTSILFALGGALKAFALPALLLLVGTSRTRESGPFGGGNWETGALFLLIPVTLVAVLRYLSFRLRYDETELVIRTGLLFRNERHVPYGRIQNLSAVRNVFHRLFGVTDVRVETGGSKEVEATISVIPMAAYEEMRRRVFIGRDAGFDEADVRVVLPAGDAATSVGDTVGKTGWREQVLLHVPFRELVLHGVIENRSLLVIGAATGLLWEVGLVERIGDRMFGDRSYGRGVMRDFVRGIADGAVLPIAEIALAIAAAVALLVVVQVASVAWTVIRLYGFRLVQVGEDLRTEFGLLTRVASTIPLRRIQTVTVYQSPLQRMIGRVSVRVETAGSAGTGAAAAAKEREWVAPILRPTALPDLVRLLVPGADMPNVDWQPVHPRAFRRVLTRSVVGALVVSVLGLLIMWPMGVVIPLIALPWAAATARLEVRHLGWAADDHVVIFRSGWLWRRTTIARVAKVQAVAWLESPFDRRTAMARVRVDTAGAGERSHRVDVRYLPRDVARHLHRRLAVLAARTEFRW